MKKTKIATLALIMLLFSLTTIYTASAYTVGEDGITDMVTERPSGLPACLPLVATLIKCSCLVGQTEQICEDPQKCTSTGCQTPTDKTETPKTTETTDTPTNLEHCTEDIKLARTCECTQGLTCQAGQYCIEFGVKDYQCSNMLPPKEEEKAQENAEVAAEPKSPNMCGTTNTCPLDSPIFGGKCLCPANKAFSSSRDMCCNPGYMCYSGGVGCAIEPGAYKTPPTKIATGEMCDPVCNAPDKCVFSYGVGRHICMPPKKIAGEALPERMTECNPDEKWVYINDQKMFGCLKPGPQSSAEPEAPRCGAEKTINKCLCVSVTAADAVREVYCEAGQYCTEGGCKSEPTLTDTSAKLKKKIGEECLSDIECESTNCKFVDSKKVCAEFETTKKDATGKKTTVKKDDCTPTTCSVITVKISGPGITKDNEWVMMGHPLNVQPGDYKIRFAANKKATTARCLTINGEKQSSTTITLTKKFLPGTSPSFSMQGYFDAECTQKMSTAGATVSFIVAGEKGTDGTDKTKCTPLAPGDDPVKQVCEPVKPKVDYYTPEQADTEFAAIEKEFVEIQASIGDDQITNEDRVDFLAKLGQLRNKLIALEPSLK
jgi:hypothetical protein